MRDPRGKGECPLFPPLLEARAPLPLIRVVLVGIDALIALTSEGGLHVLSVFVEKPFIASAPDRDPNAHAWKSGELFTYYADWLIEWCTEEIFDDLSGGTPHQHAVNRIAARQVIGNPGCAHQEGTETGCTR